MEKIIEEQGNNSWLYNNGTPHCYVCRDFFDTYDGILTAYGVETVTVNATTADV